MHRRASRPCGRGGGGAYTYLAHTQTNRSSTFTALAQEQERLGPKSEFAGLGREGLVRLIVKIGKWKE